MCGVLCIHYISQYFEKRGGKSRFLEQNLLNIFSKCKNAFCTCQTCHCRILGSLNTVPTNIVIKKVRYLITLFRFDIDTSNYSTTMLPYVNILKKLLIIMPIS